MINLRLVCGLCPEGMQEHTTLRVRRDTMEEAVNGLKELAAQYGWAELGESKEFCCRFHQPAYLNPKVKFVLAKQPCLTNPLSSKWACRWKGCEKDAICAEETMGSVYCAEHLRRHRNGEVET